MKRVRPWHGKWMSRKTAKRINDMFDSAPMPDRTQMHKEAVEFKNEMLKLREEALARGEMVRITAIWAPQSLEK